jgi:quercetin dioxygenase-like cupin family protein
MSRENKGYKVKAGEGRFDEHIELKGVTVNLLDIKISSKDTNGDLTIIEQTGITPNGGPPLHFHNSQDEIFYIIEGEYLFQVGNEKFLMKAGDTIFLPRKVAHAFVQLTEKAKMHLTFQPSGKMEEFFKKVASLTLPPSPQEMAKIFEDHDMKIVGPPLKRD